MRKEELKKNYDIHREISLISVTLYTGRYLPEELLTSEVHIKSYEKLNAFFNCLTFLPLTIYIA